MPTEQIAKTKQCPMQRGKTYWGSECMAWQWTTTIKRPPESSLPINPSPLAFDGQWARRLK